MVAKIPDSKKTKQQIIKELHRLHSKVKKLELAALPVSAAGDFGSDLSGMDFKMISDFTYDCEIFRDSNGKIRYVNPAFKRLTGYKPEDYISGKIGLKDLYADEDLESAQNCHSRVVKGETFNDLELKMKRKDGKAIYVSVSSQPVITHSGKRIGQRTSIRDITERKLAEESLAKEHNLLSSLVETIPDLIYAKDKNSKFVFANNATAKKLSLDKPEDLIGRTDYDFFPKEIANIFFAEEQGVIKTGKPALGREGWGDKKNYYIVTKVPWRDEHGNIIGIIGINHNITERKLIENTLRKSERKARAIFDLSFGFIGLLTPDGVLVEANRSALEFVGVQLSDVVGKPFWEMPWWTHSTEMQERLRAAVRTAAGGELVRFEVTYPDADGEIYTIDFSLKPVMDETGRVTLLIPEGRDITELKLAQEELAKEHNLLLNLINAIPEHIYVKDAKSRFVFINKTGAKALKSEDTESVVGKTDFDFLPVDIAQICYEEEQQILQTGKEVIDRESFGGEGVAKRSYLVTKVPWRDPQGNTIGIIGVNHEVTAIKEAQATLAKERNLLRAVVDTLPEHIYAKDSKGRFVFINNSCVKSLNVTGLESAIGKTDFDYFPDEKARAYYEEEMRIIHTGKALIDRASYGDNAFSNKFYLTSKVPWYDGRGDIIGIIGINHDITEYKQVQDSLRQAREHYKSLVESSSEHIFMLNSDGIYLTSNSIVRHLGINELTNIVGKSLFDIYSPKLAAYYQKQVRLVFTTGQPVSFEHSIDTPEGIRYHLDTLFPITSDGRVKTVGGICRDITDIKQAEKKLLINQKQLKSLASELILAEERERKQIAEHLHDDVIQTFIFMNMKVESMLTDEFSDKAKKDLSEIRGIVDDLIQRTRTLTFDLSYPVLYELGLESAIKGWLAREIRGKYGMETKFYDDGKEKPVSGDLKVHLFRSVKEILVNVVKHAKANKIIISIARDHGNVRISVKDNGIGFSAKRELNEDRGGYGLFSIRERLSLLGGSIEIRPGKGKGTEVVLLGPLKGEREK